MNKKRQKDADILLLLGKDPKEGMALLVERYTGLIWKVISLYLSDPEDIKECTNDTFAEFYFQRKRFDPEKAGLNIYLTAIARNLAISWYRKEKRRKTEAYAEEYISVDRQMELVEIRADLNKAMAVLKSDESQIIHMKYYEGMTVREIADSLELPYETVKKRHQRSLGKLRNQMFLFMILFSLLMITACSYRILVHYRVIPDYFHILFPGLSEEEDEKDTEPEIHPLLIHVPDLEEPGKQESAEEPEVTEDMTAYQSGQTSPTLEEEAALPNFTYVPGYGVNWEPDAPFYVLQDSGTIENEWVILEMTDAVYVNHTMRVELLCTSKAETLLDLSTAMRLVGSNPILNCENDQWKCKYVSSRQLTSYQEKIEVYYENIDLPDTEKEPLQMSLNNLFQIEESLFFTLAPADVAETPEYVYQLEEYGGLIAIPRLEDGCLIVEIYPVNADEEFMILPELIRGRYGESEGGQVTVTGSDGMEKTGQCVGYSPSQNVDHFEWNFGQAEPGEYTLHVPYVYQTTSLPEDFVIPINLAEESWEDRCYELPDGSLAINSCTRNVSEDGCVAWEIQMKYQSENKDRIISQLYFSKKCQEREDYVPEISLPGSIVYEKEGVTFDIKKVDGINGLIYSEVLVNTDRYDASSFQITSLLSHYTGHPAGVTYRWNQNFDLTFTVNSSE